MWFWTLVGAIPALIVYLIYKYFNRNSDYWPSRGVFLLNQTEAVSLLDRMLIRQPIHEIERKTYTAIRKDHGITSYVGVMEFGKPALVLVDLEIIKSVMVKDFDHFADRRSFETVKTDPYMSQMITNLHGQEWKNMRNTLSPTFTTGRIRRMFEVFAECGDKMTTFLNKELATKSEIEVRDLCSRYTMDVIANAAFGVDSKTFKDSNSTFAKMGKKIQASFTITKFLVAIFFPKLLNLLGIPMLDAEAGSFFANAVKSSMDHREKTGTRRDDFLQLLIDTQTGELKVDDEDKQEPDVINEKSTDIQKASKVQLSNQSLTAQAILFFIAGFDTTETLLIFAMYELALNQKVQEKLYQELDEATSKNKDGKLAYDMLMSLPYLDMVISETLRKYPAGFRLERRCTKDYTLPGTNVQIKKGQVVIIPLIGIHYDEEYYTDPETFDPERFSPEIKAKRHPYAYMPFGQGPRSCIAMRFALVEGKAAIAHLVHNFRLDTCSKTYSPMKYSKKTALKPADGGLWLSIKPRNK